MAGVKLKSIGFDIDYFQMVISIPLKDSIASVMGKLKGQSASQLHKIFSLADQTYWNEKIVWSLGYFVSSVGVDEDTIKKYVEHQGRQNSGKLQLKE